MYFSNLKQYLDNFFATNFDHDTITDPTNNPFLQICVVSAKRIFTSQTYSFYVTPPGQAQTHNTHSRVNLATVNFLTTSYLLQDIKKFNPVLKENGYCNGFAIQDKLIFLCAATTNPDDAQWICQITLAQMKIYVDNEAIT